MTKTERIVAAAGERFRYYGIRKTTMQEIAHDAGVAVGTLYLYFKNKDDLVVACAAEFVERHKATTETILASSAPCDEKLRKYVVARFRASEEMRTGTRHAVELTRAVLRVKPDRLEEEGQMMWQTVAKILAQGVEAGLFRVESIDEDAKVFLYAIAWFFPNALSKPVAPPTEEDLLKVVNWFIAAWKRGRESTARPKAKRRARISRGKVR